MSDPGASVDYDALAHVVGSVCPRPGRTPRVPSFSGARGARTVTVRLKADARCTTPLAGTAVRLIGASGVHYAGTAGRTGYARVRVLGEPIVAVEVLPRGDLAGAYHRIPVSGGTAAWLTPDELHFLPVTEVFDWGALAIGVDRVAERFSGQRVRVAVVDSGVDPLHPDLRVAQGVNLVDDENPTRWADDYGHGTFLAGIIAALANHRGLRGISPGVELYAVRVGKFDAREKRYVNRALARDLVEAISWCLEQHVDVINLSLVLSVTPADRELLETALRAAVEAGVCLVAPTGNDGQGLVSYPASSPWVLGVGALGDAHATANLSFFERDQHGAVFAADGRLFVPWFSNFGDGLDLVAPGSAVASTIPEIAGGYARYSGTSLSAGFLSAACALLIEANGQRPRGAADVRRLFDILRATADPLPGVPVSRQGHGVVRVDRAIGSLLTG